ncbi:MAG: DNA-directed RNA polymerase subunit alpha [Minisyncoccia bacterium]
MSIIHLSDSVNIKKVLETETEGQFLIEGLYPGYGVTIGNSLRRVLLSSLPGAAITQIKINGVNHEFSTIPGMKEDIIQLSLNLKKVRFHFFANEPQVLNLKVKGEKEITAGDIKSNALVEVINKNLYLATLTKKQAELDMELTVEKGLGYLPAEERRVKHLTIGTIILDALFSPIVKVGFNVENMRVGDRTDYNRLTLNINTDGSITPSEALHKAIKILQDHFAKIDQIEVKEIKLNK